VHKRSSSSSTPEGPETNLQQSLVAGDSDGKKCPKPALRCSAVEAAESSVLLDLSRDAIEINRLLHMRRWDTRKIVCQFDHGRSVHRARQAGAGVK
jgi:hypothetical protein